MMKSITFRKIGEALRTAHLVGMGHLVSLRPGPAPKSTVRDVGRFIDDDRAEEMLSDRATEAAYRRERARCQAIIFSPAAATNPALARALAFDTRMTRREAIHMLAHIATSQAFAHLEGKGHQLQQPIRVH